MKKYAKIVNPEKGIVEVGIGDPEAIWKTETRIVEPPTEQRPNGKTETVTFYVRDYYESNGMELMDVEHGYDGRWYISGYAPKKPEPTIEEILKGYENAVQAHLDATAQSRDYDNTYTCLSYLSSTDEIWNRESNAFNAWRDSVWRKCHEILNAVMAGAIEPPTVEELISQLPEIDWNDPVPETVEVEE